MSEKNKSMLIILSTLLIGMLIGALSWSGISKKRNNSLANLRQTEGMMEFVLRNLEPLEEEQKTSIRSIVRAHGDEIQEMRSDMRDLQRSLLTDLAEVLNEDQQSRLDQVLRSRNRRGGRPDGPPEGRGRFRGEGPEDSTGVRRPGDRRNRPPRDRPRRDRPPPRDSLATR